MKLKTTLILVALVTVMATSLTWLLAQPDQEMSAEELEIAKKWMAFGSPGKMHERLAERVGKWTFISKMWQHPGAEVAESKGTSTTEMILGGRYLFDTTEGAFQGMPFKVTGITGKK